MRRAGTLVAGGFAVLLGLVFGLMLLGGQVAQSCGSNLGVSATGEPPLVQYYIGAARRYALGSDGYAYLAAINNVETTFGTNMSTSSAGAIGWMQFEPGTFRSWGVAVTNPGGQPDPFNPQDAVYSAANYLHGSGAPQSWSAAIFAYNHAGWYVAQVQGLAARYSGQAGLQNLNTDIQAAWGGKQPPKLPMPTTIPVAYSPPNAGQCCPTAPVPTAAPVATAPAGLPGAGAGGGAGGCAVLVDDVTPVPGKTAVIMPNGLARPPEQAPVQVQAMIAAGDRITHFDYQYGGGHADPALSDSQRNPQPEGGLAPGDNGTPGYDCSGATSYVIFGGGLGPSLLGGQPLASGAMESIGDAGSGKWVTIFANPGHAFIEVAGVVLDTAHYAPVQPAQPSTGPRWQPGSIIPLQVAGDQYGGFIQRHPPGL
jgi:hypothetical protein